MCTGHACPLPLLAALMPAPYYGYVHTHAPTYTRPPSTGIAAHLAVTRRHGRSRPCRTPTHPWTHNRTFTGTLPVPGWPPTWPWHGDLHLSAGLMVSFGQSYRDLPLALLPLPLLPLLLLLLLVVDDELTYGGRAGSKKYHLLLRMSTARTLSRLLWTWKAAYDRQAMSIYKVAVIMCNAWRGTSSCTPVCKPVLIGSVSGTKRALR